MGNPVSSKIKNTNFAFPKFKDNIVPERYYIIKNRRYSILNILFLKITDTIFLTVVFGNIMLICQ